MPIARSRIRSIKCWRALGGRLPHVSIFGIRCHAKDHLAHLVAQASDFFRIGGAPEARGEVEELLLSALLSLHAVLDELEHHPVCADPARFRQAPNLGSDVRRQANALPRRSVCHSHATIMHQIGVGRRDADLWGAIRGKLPRRPFRASFR